MARVAALRMETRTAPPTGRERPAPRRTMPGEMRADCGLAPMRAGHSAQEK